MKILLGVFGIPLIVWICSYIYLALYHKRWNIINTKIHESGRYTLLETIFYFNHFLREVLIDTIFVFCVFLVYDFNWLKDSLVSYYGYILPLFLFFILVILIGSILKVGLKNSLLDIFQFRELDTIIEFGSHWQMHFLSTFLIMLMLVFPAMLSKGIIIIFPTFLALSLFFDVELRSITDKRWLMHGGREILTYSLILIIPVYSIIPINTISIFDYLVGFLIIMILIYYSFAFLRTNIKDIAQGGYKLPYLLASHFFEHILDYVYMVLLLLVLIGG